MKTSWIFVILNFIRKISKNKFCFIMKLKDFLKIRFRTLNPFKWGNHRGGGMLSWEIKISLKSFLFNVFYLRYSYLLIRLILTFIIIFKGLTYNLSCILVNKSSSKFKKTKMSFRFNTSIFDTFYLFYSQNSK